MQQPRPQLNPLDFALVELILVDDDDQLETIELQVTEEIWLRLPADIEPDLAAAIVEAICAC